jgi:hypothetical protein
MFDLAYRIIMVATRFPVCDPARGSEHAAASNLWPMTN